LAFVLAAHAEADKVTLVKGKEVVSGKITKDDRDGLEIEIRDRANSGAKRTLTSNEILDVEWDLADQDAADGLRQFKDGKYGQAAESLAGIVGQKEAMDRMRPVARPFLVYAFAESLMHSGRAAQAYPVYQFLTENYKTSRYAPMALSSMAAAAVQAKQFDKLPPLLAQLREAGGDQKQRADLLEADALLMQGKAKEALARYTSAAAGGAAIRAQALAGQARAYAASGDLAKARDAAQATLAANPTPDVAADAHVIIGDALMADIDAKKPAGAALVDALLDAALEYLRVQNQYAASADSEGHALLKAGECFQRLSTLPTRASADDRERAVALYGRLQSERRFAGSDYANKAFKHMEEMKAN
jgi:tetratricopeptide (TPR) repeat protein